MLNPKHIYANRWNYFNNVLWDVVFTALIWGTQSCWGVAFFPISWSQALQLNNSRLCLDSNNMIHWSNVSLIDSNNMINWSHVSLIQSNNMIHWSYVSLTDSNIMIHWSYASLIDSNNMIHWAYVCKLSPEKWERIIHEYVTLAQGAYCSLHWITHTHSG